MERIFGRLRKSVPDIVTRPFNPPKIEAVYYDKEFVMALNAKKWDGYVVTKTPDVLRIARVRTHVAGLKKVRHRK